MSDGSSKQLSPYDSIGSYRWWVQKWNYTNTRWQDITSFSQLTANDGMQITNNTAEGDVKYTFYGKLVSHYNNSLSTNGVGANFFSNSFLGNIKVSTLIDLLPSDVENKIYIETKQSVIEISKE